MSLMPSMLAVPGWDRNNIVTDPFGTQTAHMHATDSMLKYNKTMGPLKNIVKVDLIESPTNYHMKAGINISFHLISFHKCSQICLVLRKSISI